MYPSYTDEEFEEIEEEELSITVEAIAFMSILLALTHSDLVKEVQSFYQRYGRDGVITWADVQKWTSEDDHRKRWATLMFSVQDQFNSSKIDLEAEFRWVLTEVAKVEERVSDTELDVDKILATKWGEDVDTWDNRLFADIALWTARILADLKQSIVRKDHVDTVLKNMDDRFKSIEKALSKLVITESTAIGTIARLTAFKELGVKEYRFYTKADERVCNVCGGMHGRIFPISAYEPGVTASPMHPRCRCFEIPVTE